MAGVAFDDDTFNLISVPPFLRSGEKKTSAAQEIRTGQLNALRPTAEVFRLQTEIWKHLQPLLRKRYPQVQQQQPQQQK